MTQTWNPRGFRSVNGSSQGAPETQQKTTGTTAADQQAAVAAAVNQQYLAVNTRWAALPTVSGAGYHPIPSAYTVIPQTQFWGGPTQSPQGGQ